MSVLIVNAGLAGSRGNSAVVARHCQAVFGERCVAHETIVLADADDSAVSEALARADRLVLVSGTYWGGFSSSLQALLERFTATEASALWLGKPVSVLVTAHQVGAQSVLFRLQGVLACFGCAIPPLSGVVITKTGEALRHRAPQECNDVWGLADVETALHNLLATPYTPSSYRAWSVDRDDFAARWLETPK